MDKLLLDLFDAYYDARRNKRNTNSQLLNIDLIDYLTDVIISRNPLDNCKIRGLEEDWLGLPTTKSLRYAPEGFGLPIGDLTSQLFSNVYLNKLDWYVKRELGFKHYGRYVDDFYFVDNDKYRLQQAIEQIREFLKKELGLTLHPKKIVLHNVLEGVEFLGAIVRPYYRHSTKRTTRKFNRCWQEWEYVCSQKKISQEKYDKMFCSINSYLGYFQHYRMKKFLKHRVDVARCVNKQFLFAGDYGKVGKVKIS